MSFVLIWLMISVVCTSFVLLCIKYAPSWDDEPLNSISASPSQDDERIQHQDAAPKGRKDKPRNIKTVKRSDVRVDQGFSGSKLTDFIIVRTDEPLSRDVATDL